MASKPKSNIIKACINLETGRVHQFTPRLANRNDMKIIWYDLATKRVTGEAPGNFTEEEAKSPDPIIQLPVRPEAEKINARGEAISALDEAIAKHNEEVVAINAPMAAATKTRNSRLNKFEQQAMDSVEQDVQEVEEVEEVEEEEENFDIPTLPGSADFDSMMSGFNQ